MPGKPPAPPLSLLPGRDRPMWDRGAFSSKAPARPSLGGPLRFPGRGLRSGHFAGNACPTTLWLSFALHSLSCPALSDRLPVYQAVPALDGRGNVLFPLRKGTAEVVRPGRTTSAAPFREGTLFRERRCNVNRLTREGRGQR